MMVPCDDDVGRTSYLYIILATRQQIYMCWKCNGQLTWKSKLQQHHRRRSVCMLFQAT